PGAGLGLANLDVLFGLSPTLSLRDVVRGERRLEDVVVDGPAGIRIIPAASGFEELTRLGSDEQLRLLAEIDGLEDSFDVLLVDTAAGISANVLYFTAAAAGSPASQGLAALAGRLALRAPGRPTGGVQFFFRRLVGEGRAS